jgi:hypothetical protein
MRRPNNRWRGRRTACGRLSGPSTSPLNALFRRLVASLIAALVPAALAGPWTPYDASVEKQHAVSVEAYKRIDFLTPSALPEPQQTLDCAATFDVRPSFAPERHWRLRRNGSTYSLESWKSARSGGSQAGAHDAEHRTVPFPFELATLVREIWLNAILESHYPRLYLGGADGDDYYFGATRDDSLLLRAEVWSPDADLPPRWLVEAGDQIFNYAQRDSNDAVVLRKSLVALRKRLFNYYEEHGRH